MQVVFLAARGMKGQGPRPLGHCLVLHPVKAAIVQRMKLAGTAWIPIASSGRFQTCQAPFRP